MTQTDTLFALSKSWSKLNIELFRSLSPSLNKVDALERVAYAPDECGFFLPLYTNVHFRSFVLPRPHSFSRRRRRSSVSNGMSMHQQFVFALSHDHVRRKKTTIDVLRRRGRDARGLLINLSVGLFDRAD